MAERPLTDSQRAAPTKASMVEDAVQSAFGIDSHFAPTDEAYREVQVKRAATLAELRDLEDCRLIIDVLRLYAIDLKPVLGYEHPPPDALDVIRDVLDHEPEPLTDEERAVLVKACGETVEP